MESQFKETRTWVFKSLKKGEYLRKSDWIVVGTFATDNLTIMINIFSKCESKEEDNPMEIGT